MHSINQNNLNDNIFFLDSSNSYYGFKWQISKNSEKTLEDIFRDKYKPIEENNTQKRIQDFWPKNGEIPDIDKGCELIANALKNKKKVGIVGDYDVDGSSATGMLIAYFSLINLDFKFHIPNRFEEGYGITPEIIKKIIDVDIIITVDNGTTAYEAIDFIKQQKKQMIIIDHHHIQKPIEIDAFINPHRIPNNDKFNILCAGGLTFIFLFELNKYLFDRKFIEENHNIYNFIDIATVSTICDVMPLRGINRAIVSLGIKKLNLNPQPGYGAILERYKGNIDVTTVGFILGPSINAPGRLGSAHRAVEIASETDIQKARNIAADLIHLNNKRKDIEREALISVEDQLKIRGVPENSGIVVYGDWFEGVIGIIAGRLKDKYYKPVCVLTKNKNMWKGSLRSVEGFHIGNLVKKSIDLKITSFGGGHEMAGGLSISEENLDLFLEFFARETQGNFLKNNILKIDAIVNLEALDSIYNFIEIYGPFGTGYEAPLFLFPDCIITRKKMFSKDNKSFSILLQITNSTFSKFVDIWIFRATESLFNSISKRIDILGRVIKSNNKISIEICDFQCEY